MVVKCLAVRIILAFWCATTLFLIRCQCGKGTLLAPILEEAETERSLHSKRSFWSEAGEEESKEGATGLCATFAPSQLESSRIPYPQSEKNDVDVQGMPSSKFGSVSQVPLLSSTLERCMATIEETTEEPVQQGSQEGQSEEAERPNGERRMGSLPEQATMGSINTRVQIAKVQGRKQQWSGYATTTTAGACTSASTTIDSQRTRIVSGRNQEVVSSARSSSIGLRDVSSPATRTQGTGITGQKWSCEDVVAWTHQSSQEAQIPSSGGDEQDYLTGSRMEWLHTEGHPEDSSARAAIPTMSWNSAGGFQYQATRALEIKAGNESSITDIVGGTGCSSNSSGHARLRARLSKDEGISGRKFESGPHGSGCCGRDPGFGQWRGADGECRTRSQTNVQDQVAAVQESWITGQSGANAFEAQAQGEQGQGLQDGLNRSMNVESNESLHEAATKHVRFRDEVEVSVYDDRGDQVNASFNLDNIHTQLRLYWHMDGQISDAPEVFKALRRLGKRSENATSVDMNTGSCAARGSSRDENCDALGGVASQAESGLVNLVYQIQEILKSECHRGFVRYVETWYLAPGRNEVCVQSRRIAVDSDGGVTEFLRKCQEVWIDAWEHASNTRFDLVQPQPPNRLTTVAHVIIVQSNDPEWQTMLMKCDALPPLSQHRAVAFQHNMRVQQLFRIAQLPGMCARVEHMCCIRAESENQAQVLCNDDMVRVGSGSFVQGFLRPIEVHDEDSDSASSSSEGEVSTDVGSYVSDSSDGTSTHEQDDVPTWISFAESSDNPMIRDMLNDLREHDANGAIDNDESVFMTFSGIHTWEAQPIPYSWDHADEAWYEEPGVEQVEEPIEDVSWAPDSVAQIQNHIAQEDRALAILEGPRQWLLITFGLGVGDLGRRDVMVDLTDLQDVRERVRHLWADHAGYAFLQIQVVQPQPQLSARASLVVLVVVQYTEYEEENAKSVLVIEDSAFDIRHREQPYASYLSDRVSARGVALQLGIQTCFPLGLRECEARVRGVQLHSRRLHEIVDGSLCEVYVGAAPEHAMRASHILRNAEQFFISAQTSRENMGGHVQILIRVHGISPQNAPLGARDWWVTLKEATTLPLIGQLQQLWHFYEYEDPRMSYVIEGSGQENHAGVLVYHFIVSYARGHAGKPVLVRQQLRASDDDTTHSEEWAIMLNGEPDEDRIFEQIWRPPFWFHRIAYTQMSREGKPLSEMLDIGWEHCNVLHLHLEVSTTRNMLSVMHECGLMAFDDPPIDHVELLQLSATQMQRLSGFANACRQLINAEGTVECEAHDKIEVRNNGPDDTDGSTIQSNHVEAPGDPWVSENDGSSREATGQLDGSLNDEIRTLRSIVQDLLCDDWQGLNWDFTILPPMHPAANYAIQHTSVTETTTNRFHIYTDGSCKAGHAAWAFIVVCEIETPLGRSFCRIGYAGDKLPENDGHRWTSEDAEAAALIAMCDYLLARPWIEDMQLHCYFDSTSVGYAGFGVQNVPHGSKSSMVYKARVLLSMVQRKYSTKGIHVHAHEQNPFNEFVDSLASAVRQGFECRNQAVLRTHKLFEHPMYEWAWLEVHPTSEIPDVQTILSQVQESPDQSWPDKVLAKSCEPRKDTSAQQITLQVATVNVGTMHYTHGECDQVLSSKVHELAHQFDNNGWDVVCLQETRARYSCQRVVGPYSRIIAAGQKGCAGVEIWVHEELVRSKLGCDFDGAQDITVWHSDTRVLAIHLNVQGWQVDVVTCYAPQRGRQMEEIRSWWKDFRQVCKKRTWHCPMWIAGDFNCSVGSITSEWIGDCDPDFEDEPGSMMHEFVAEMRMKVVNTCSRTHAGQSWTYSGPQGAHSRLDYVIVSEDCWPGVSCSWVDDQTDVLNGGHDHSPVVMKITFQYEQHDDCALKRLSRYDRCEARKPENRHHDLCKFIPEIPWQIPVSEHWSWIRDTLQSQAAKRYPKPKRQKRQVYFSPEVWSMVCHRKDIRQQHRQQQRALSHLFLRKVFHAWCRKSEPDDGLACNMHLLRLQEALTYEQQRALDCQYKSKKRQDWKNWVEGQMTEQVQKLRSSSGSELFRILQPKKIIAKHQGKSRRPQPGLRNAEGQWCRSRSSIAISWQQQFSDIENAEGVNAVEFVAMEQGHCGPNTVDTLKQTPTLYDLQWAFRNLNDQKAPGLDGLGAEIFQSDLCSTSIRLYAMMVKMCMRRQWATELTGGWLLPLWKGKNCPQDMQSYRGILLEPTITRGFSRSWRGKLAKGLADYAEPNQWGGRAGLSCSALHLQLKMLQSSAKVQCVSQAIVFVDVRAAFYSVAKPLLHGGQYQHDDFVKVCNRMNIPVTAREAFAKNVANTNAIWNATQSEVMTDMAEATLRKTWYTIPNGSHMYAPLTGSRPGDPLADLFFGVVMATMLKEVHARCEGTDIFQPEAADHIRVDEVTWVDDLAFVITSDATTLCGKVMHLVSILYDVMTEFGFSLSVGQGKTAVMLTFRGPQARKTRIWSEKTFATGMPIVTEHCSTVRIPVVHYYKHLGGFLSRQDTCLHEMMVRAGQALSRIAPLTKIMRDDRIDVQHKRTLVKTMAWPVLSLHAGCWWDLTESEYHAWQGAWHRVTGVLYKRDADGEVVKNTMQQRALDLQCPMPMEMLMLHRLRLLAHILSVDDDFMTGAVLSNYEIAGEKSWLAGVHTALKWMQQQIGSGAKIRPLLGIVDEISWRHAVPLTQSLKKMIHKAEKAHQMRLRAYCDVHDADKLQSEMLREAGWIKMPGDEGLPVDVNTCECAECGYVARSEAALAVHEQRKHGHRIALRRFVEDGVCRFCRKQFHTRPRLVQHLQLCSRGCWYKLMRACEPMTEEQTAHYDSQDRQQGVAFHQKGMKDKQQELASRACEPDELQSNLLWNIHPDEVPDDPPTTAEIHSWSQYGMLPPGQGGRTVTQRGETWFAVPNVLEDVQALERKMCSELVKWEPFHDFVPRPLVEDVKYFLIFFAGHRRKDDISDFIHREAGGKVVPVAIDTAVSERHGNVYHMTLWKGLVQARKVLGAHAGPPCETFTMARFLRQDEPGNPRPLRTKSHPWGLPELSLRELIQCVNGSSLYLHVLGMILMVHLYGGCSTLEHPKGTDDDQHPGWTVWYSSFMKRLLLDGQFQRITMLQGPLGREFSKPTRLLAGRLPWLERDIFAAYDTSWRPSVQLGGRNPDGSWRTSAAKAYPAGMCRVLARAYLRFGQEVDVAGTETDPEGLHEALEALAKVLDADSVEGRMGNDFQIGHFI